MWCNINIFFFVLAVVLLIEMAFSRYTKSVLTPLERQLNLTSKQLGLLGTCQQIGELAVCLLVSYLGGRWSRPKFLGFGCIIMLFGAFLSAFPHFIIPSQNTIFNQTVLLPPVCQSNASYFDNSRSWTNQGGGKQSSTGYFIIIVLGQIAFGLGMSPLKPLGLSYLDDNLNKNKSAVYLGVLVSTYFAGQVLGFLLSGWTSRLWVDPGDPPAVNSDLDPRWISAWWLGFLICSVFLLFGCLFFLFPKEMKSADNAKTVDGSIDVIEGEDEPASDQTEHLRTPDGCSKHSLNVDNPGDDEITEQNKHYERLHSKLNDWSENPFLQKTDKEKCNSLNAKEIWDDFKQSGKDLLTDSYFVLTILGSIFVWFYLSAYSVFIIKYVEHQFVLSTSQANILFGLVPMPFTIVGTIVGGVIINRSKLSISGIFRLMCILSLLGILTHALGYFLIHCDAAQVLLPHGSRNCLPADCHCSDGFFPVCGGGVTFSSSCLAGCKDYTVNRRLKYMNFTSCSCSSTGYAISGRCNNTNACSLPTIHFIVVNGIGAFLFGTLCSSNVIVLLRIVSHKNKSFAIGIMLVCNKLLGAIPGPVIAGAIIDRSCEWYSEGMACAAYDLTTFRLYFGTLLLCSKVLTFIVFGVCVILLCKNPHVDDNSSLRNVKE